MSVTPFPGYGIYAIYHRPAGGLRTAANVFAFQNTAGAIASAAITTVRNAVRVAAGPYATSKLSTTYDWVGDYCLVNNGGALFSAANTAVVAGTATIDPPAPNTSVIIRKYTILAGRQYRGRWALPAGFIDEGNIDNSGAIGAGTLAALGTAATAMLTAMSTAGVPMALLHGPPLVGVTPTPTLVSVVSPDGIVGTQRKRLR